MNVPGVIPSPALRDWSSVPVVAVELTEAEALAGGPDAQQRRNARPIIYANGVVQVSGGVLRLFDHRSLFDQIFGSAQIAIGIGFCVLPQFIAPTRPRGRREFQVEFNETGITIEADGRTALPWQRIESVQDTGDVFVFRAKPFRTVIVPQRFFPDHGVRLWSLLEDRLIAKQGLRRRPGTRTIVNTAVLG